MVRCTKCGQDRRPEEYPSIRGQARRRCKFCVQATWRAWYAAQLATEPPRRPFTIRGLPPVTDWASLRERLITYQYHQGWTDAQMAKKLSHGLTWWNLVKNRRHTPPHYTVERLTELLMRRLPEVAIPQEWHAVVRSVSRTANPRGACDAQSPDSAGSPRSNRPGPGDHPRTG